MSEDWFEQRQLELTREVDEELEKTTLVYDFLTPRVGDADITKQMKKLHTPTKLPTLTRAILLTRKGVMARIPADVWLKLRPTDDDLPKRDEVREGIWELLDWGGR